MEATKPVGFYLAKNLEGYWLWLRACGTFFWVFVGKKLEAWGVFALARAKTD